MAYFKLSLLTKAYDKDNPNRYIKNVISEFYGNNVDEQLIQYERENNLAPQLKSGTTNIYTKTYTYNEKLNIHQQGQKDLTFSLDKMILDDDTWKDNPFASKIKSGGQLLLEDKYNNIYLFTVKNITYTITENNIVYNFTCQDSFSYQLAKQNDGYTIKNDINSKNFIGALNIDSWVDKIVKECKIAYKYLKLETPLYLCTDGTAINTTLKQSASKKVLKILKTNYLNTPENADLYETIPFSCSSTTANGALISLGEQIGLVLNTATVLVEPEKNSVTKLNDNFITLITYFWFEPSKKDLVSGLKYSPFRNIKTFNLSEKSDSLVTTLNIDSRTLSNDEVITALPTVSPFFMSYFGSTYWKRYSEYYPGMYSNLLYGPQFSIDSSDSIPQYNTSTFDFGKVYISHSGNEICFKMRLEEKSSILYSLYNIQVYQTQKVRSSFSFKNNIGELKVSTSDNSNFTTTIGTVNNFPALILTVENDEFQQILQPDNYIEDFEFHIFFKTEYTDEDETFARIADQLPWLENKLIDYTHFIKAGLLSKPQQKDINQRIYNDLRKINSDILLSAAAYYSRVHSQTKYLAEMTNNIDMVGAEVSSIVDSYKRKGSNNSYDTNNLITRWSLLQANISGAAPASQTDISGSMITSTFMDLYETTSDYMRKFLNARQRCLKNLYNFRQYFETPLDDIYKKYYEVTITINDSDTDNIYRFEPNKEDQYRTLTMDYVNNTHSKFFKVVNGQLVDYNNIRLYNNDAQHSMFDKENYLITNDNYDNMTVHCYENVLHKCGEYDKYNKDTQYLRQVFFLRLNDILNMSNWIPTITDEDKKSISEGSLNLHIAIKVDNVYYPCQCKIYEKDSNYLVCNKKYEDGIAFDGNKIYLFSDSKIIVNGHTYTRPAGFVWQLGNKALYVGQNANAVLNSDTIKFVPDNSSTCDGFVFYQPIYSSDILKNYLYRAGSNLKIKKDYSEESLSDLYNVNWIDTDVGDYKEYPNPNNEYQNTDNNFLGWGKLADISIGWEITSFFIEMFGGSALKSWFRRAMRNDFLVLGGYKGSNSHLSENLYLQFSPYKSRSSKKHSAYFKNFPLNTIYNGNTSMTLVTSTNYQNFYTRISENTSNYSSCSLGNKGIFQSFNGYRVAKDSNELFDDFMSDFPKEYFYSIKPIKDGDANSLAYTFGNIIAHSTNFNNYKYRKTITYTRVRASEVANLSDDINLLVIDLLNPDFYTHSFGETLNQYSDYDIINKGIILNRTQVLQLPVEDIDEDDDVDEDDFDKKYAVYYIIDGVLEDLSTSISTKINQIFTETITDQYGKQFNISELQSKPHIVEKLYYIEQEVKMTPAALQYDLRNHLQDNIYEWYNSKDERVYTINQLLGNLLYKVPQIYTYYTFDKQINQYVRMYRYNYQSVTPDIINYQFNIESSATSINGYAPYTDFNYDVTITEHSSTLVSNPTNGDFWYEYTLGDSSLIPLREHAALIESNLQLYWNEASAASLLCDIFVPDEWRIKQDKVVNHFEVAIKTNTNVVLNSVYVPKIIKTTDKQYMITWSDVPPQIENSELYTYNQLSTEQQSEVDKMLERTQNVSTNYLYFTKIADKISYYTIQTGGCNWATFLNQSVGLYLPDYTGWNGIAITYLTSHFVDAGTSNYELLLQKRDDLWRSFYEEYPYLFLETSYSNDSATTSEELLTMAKYAFEDQKYPEKSYSISLIDLVQDVETLDNSDGTENPKYTYNPKYYRGPELHIGEGIKISAEDYTNDRDDIYEALSQLLFITDISRDLRNDGNCQLTVNTIKYQDKLIRRLAKMIRRNPLN